MATVSAMPPKRRIWARPNVGTLESAAKPMPSLRMSENWTEPSRVMEPGKVMPSSWTIMPRNAIMEMRPCLISTARRRARPSVSSNMKPEGVIGPGSTPMSPLTTTLEAACWPGATKATAGAARRARASLAILICCLRGARRVSYAREVRAADARPRGAVPLQKWLPRISGPMRRLCARARCPLAAARRGTGQGTLARPRRQGAGFGQAESTYEFLFG
ncbi:unnamed protein product [Pelagomonas calceolata]|uniref:Uncharacterized protein n=1 Tax=Pelagomonas calceolata TaxID=35677 RepID=A0A8J2SV10_9STRA|nr:unnamed protein product [Pelagomonas calceolata]